MKTAASRTALQPKTLLLSRLDSQVVEWEIQLPEGAVVEFEEGLLKFDLPKAVQTWWFDRRG